MRSCAESSDISEWHANLRGSLYKAAGDAQHVCVLRQLQQIPLQLLFIPGDFT